MITLPISKLYAPCPNCKDGQFQITQIPANSAFGPWACDQCHVYVRGKRLGAFVEMTVSPSGEVETPVTVVLMSDTVPRIRLTLNAWKYRHCQKDTQEEYAEHQRYHYNEHTCPTNYLGQVEEIAVEDLARGGWDTDPHGVFKFVSTADGEWVNPRDLPYYEEVEEKD